MNWLLKQCHLVCWRGDWIAMAFSRLFFRWWCPYPLNGNYRARDCVRAGNCGCNNKPRYHTAI